MTMINFLLRVILVLVFLSPLAHEARAQSTGRVVADCTAGVPLAYAIGSTSMMTMLATGVACTNASGGGGGAVTIANGADVALGSTTDAAATVPTSVTAATTIALLKALNNTAASAIPAGTAIIGKVGIDQTTPGTTNGVQVNAALPAGANVIGHVIVDTTSTTAVTQATASNLNATVVGTGTFAVQATPTVATTGGPSSFFVQPAASDNHTVIKNGAGQVYQVLVFNNSATVNYLRFYDAGTGFNGCNSATGIISQIQIPAATSVGGVSIPFGFGMVFATGISICVTSGYATNDTTNATASAMSLTVLYK